MTSNQIERLEHPYMNTTFDFLFYETENDCPINLGNNWQFSNYAELQSNESVIEYEFEAEESSGDYGRIHTLNNKK